MKLKSAMLALLAVGWCLTTFTSSVWAMGKPHSQEAPMPAAQGMAHYVCPSCHVMSDMAGKCPKCGADMSSTHILAIKNGMAYCCGCSANCTCKMVEGDTSKCSCGKDIVKVDIKGKYVCPSNKCPSISDKPGKCPCGRDLVKAE